MGSAWIGSGDSWRGVEYDVSSFETLSIEYEKGQEQDKNAYAKWQRPQRFCLAAGFFLCAVVLVGKSI